jgi:putative phosphoribosyl transferase
VTLVFCAVIVSAVSFTSTFSRRDRVSAPYTVGSPETCQEFAEVADEIVCARAPDRFAAVGQWYRDFSQTTDEEVRDLLHEASQTAARER